MFGGVEMFGSVGIFRAIAATDVTAFEAQTQVYPAIADFKAIFAALRAGPNFLDLVQMRTFFAHKFLLLLSDNIQALACFAGQPGKKNGRGHPCYPVTPLRVQVGVPLHPLKGLAEDTPFPIHISDPAQGGVSGT